MTAPVPLSTARRARNTAALREAMAMLRSGAHEIHLQARWGKNVAQRARAALWAENGSDPKDPRGKALHELWHPPGPLVEEEME